MPLPSIASSPTLDDLAHGATPTPAVAAPVSFLDRFKLGFKQAGAAPDWGLNQANWSGQALDEIETELTKRGWQKPRPIPGVGQVNDIEDTIAALNKARESDPKLLPDYASVVDRKSFDALIRERRRKALSEVDDAAPDGLGVAGFLGGVTHAAKDPLSYLPIGGPEVTAASTGGRILAHALTGAAINAGVTVGMEPFVQLDANALGQKRGVGDFVTDLLTSSAFGSVVGGTHGAVGLIGPGVRAGSFAGAARQADADAFGRALKSAVDHSNLAPGSPFSSFDATVARAFSEAIPRDQRTPDEQASIDAITRDAEVKASSPFVPGPEGDDAHAAHLGRAMQALHEPDSLPQRGAVSPVARETIAGPDDVAGTRMPARELLKAKIHAVEAPHGGANLSGGSAFGPYQFEPRTWVNLFKRRYPNDPRSFDEIAGLRGDPHLNDVLINDLIAENAAALRHAKFEANAGNLYLAHVLGHDRAVRVLSADPNARLGDLLPANYFHGNPFKPTDTAASLTHWAYAKMGDKTGVPVHLATDEAAAGAEAISTAEASPDVQPGSTGRFDVEALYGDVGMTDRPVLNPDHFASPEQHAVAQVRFERASDAADGFAPVMSRAEAFSPAEHFDALRRYQGKVTAEAIGEALGLNPDEVRRAVGSMQATDPKSPFILTKGRQPKYAADGSVIREGTEAGRVIRRPPTATRKNETMLEFLTRHYGGLKDVGGDIASMGGDEWHKGGAFRRKLIDNEHGVSLDDAFQAAIDADYFPEHNATRFTGDTSLPDPQDFLDAIDAELRGKPRYSSGEMLDVADAQRRARYDPEEEAAFYAAAERHFAPKQMTDEEWSTLTHGDATARPFLQREADKLGLEGVGDDLLADVYQRVVDGQPLDEAFAHAVAASAARDLEDFAALAGEMGYEPSDDANAYIGEFPEVRDYSGAGEENVDGGGRSAAPAGGPPESRAELAQLAHDPKAGRFSDPVGDAAEAQADSAIHDIEMTAADGGTYRLDEEGGEQGLASILDEIEQAQRATDEMRNCLKPKGGEE